MTRSTVSLHDPCETCPASEGCWNYGRNAHGLHVGWFDCENACGPHNASSQPVDIRKCAHVTSFGPKYIHTTYPSFKVEGADEIVAYEKEYAPIVKHLEESMHDERSSA